MVRFLSIVNAKDTIERRLNRTILFNAGIIRRSEGRSRSEAEYLSICTLLDSLRTQPDGENVRERLVTIVERAYPRHLWDVLDYCACKSGEQRQRSPSPTPTRPPPAA